MSVLTENEERVNVIKRIHIIVAVLYSITFSFCMFAFFVTLNLDLQNKFLTISIVTGILITLHLVAYFIWDSKPTVAIALSGLLGFLLLFGFVLGTVFGAIILYKLARLNTSSQESDTLT